MHDLLPQRRRAGTAGSRIIVSLLTLLLSTVLLCSLLGCSGSVSGPIVDKETLFQVSTINALMDGLYDGIIPLDQLKNYGDFGIGTFENLDGEMIEADGQFYQVKADGKVYLMSGSVMAPFACVTFFNADREEKLAQGMDYAKLVQFLDGKLPTPNIFYAVRIEGTFSYIKTRSVPAQDKPYPPLSEVTKNQSVFEFHDVEGTVIGFRCPSYVTGVNVPGYHLHFLTKNNDAGGHILDLTVSDAVARIDDTSSFMIRLPGQDSDFYKLNFSQDQQSEVEKVEK
jgi:acetolactate decarboxylase